MGQKIIYFLLSLFATSGLWAQSLPKDTKGIMWTGDDEIANALVWRGLNHLMNIEREKAFTYFKAAVEQDPSLFAPHVFLSWSSSGDTRAHHKAQAQKLVSSKNEVSKLYASLLDIKPGKGAGEKWRATWKKMHKLAPEGPFIHYNYARTLQDPEAQISELKVLMAANEKNERNSDYIHNMLGYIYYAEGDKENAKMHFEKYLKMRPEGYNSYDSMAEFYREEGDLNQARMYYKKALEKYPASVSATNAVKEIEAELGASSISVDLPEVFSATAILVKEGHSPPEVTNNVRKLNQGLKKFGKGIGYWISYGDRGEREGKLSSGFTFDYKGVRDYYFPKADDNSEGANPHFEALMEELQEHGIYFNQDLTEQEGGYTDYVCVGFNKLIKPTLGGLVAVRPLMVKKETEAEFEDFVSSELYPAFARHLPGVRAYVYKGDRGEAKGEYILLWSFDSVERRNGYFPSAGDGPSKEFMSENEKLTPTNEKLNTFLSEEMTGGTYTDYVTIDVGS